MYFVPLCEFCLTACLALALCVSLLLSLSPFLPSLCLHLSFGLSLSPSLRVCCSLPLLSVCVVVRVLPFFLCYVAFLR